MFLCKINNDIAFWLSCRCNVSQVCAVSWYLKMNRFPKDFKELYHTSDACVFTRSLKEIEGCDVYMVYKDPFVRIVDDYALLTTSRNNYTLKSYMKYKHRFFQEDSFDDFMKKVVREEMNAKRQEGHFQPQSDIIDRFNVDYLVRSEDLSLFFKEKELPYNDFDYNECDSIEYEPYLKYRDEIYCMYSKDLEIPNIIKIWIPEHKKR